MRRKLIVPSQIKYWVFGFVAAIGAFLVINTIFQSTPLAVGTTLFGAMVGAMILGGVWDACKESETARTYKKEARDEEARQEYLAIKQKGAKQLEGPPKEATEE